MSCTIAGDADIASPAFRSAARFGLSRNVAANASPAVKDARNFARPSDSIANGRRFARASATVPGSAFI